LPPTAPHKASKKCLTYIFTLKKATATSVKILDNFQHLRQPIPKSQSFTFTCCQCQSSGLTVIRSHSCFSREAINKQILKKKLLISKY
jgi:hypothetical protein